MAKRYRFILKAFNDAAQPPKGVELQAFVKSSGDTVGILQVLRDGGFVFWRKGQQHGPFPTITKVYECAARLDDGT